MTPPPVWLVWTFTAAFGLAFWGLVGLVAYNLAR